MHAPPTTPRSRPALRMTLAGLALAATSSLQAAPLGWVLNTNQTLDLVNVATNADIPVTTLPFQSDSLAASPGGALYVADGFGNLWDVTGPPIPVGPTLRTQIADLDWATNGLWGYSNATQELFYFDLGSSSVTYAATLTLPGSLSPAAVVSGVAHDPGTGDIYLSAWDGLNNDFLLRVAASTTAALLVGAMSHGDSFSYVADIDFDATGTLHALTWYHRWFYSVSPVTAATSFISSGPHRDSTAMALQPVPVPAAAWLFGGGLIAVGACARRARQPDNFRPGWVSLPPWRR
ncbi:MAG: VPLPA-CTERM sorting domain-containing protein [Gammaproteobacteria bacterium]|nr:VPLPA-CTERM sorting domain-containing protein [Gammaproteobacteria bacterium]